MSRALAAALVLALAVTTVLAGEIPGALIVLEMAPGTPGSDPSGAPPRFVLLQHGQVFVSGTSLVEAGRLEKRESDALRKRAAALRKIPGIGSPISLGGAADVTMRLSLLEEDRLEIVTTGDPAAAPASLAPLATLLAELARFHHTSLRPYAPSSYAMTVREARLVGGCRAWSFSFPIAEALAGPRSVPAAEAEGWPTGAMPVSVCADDRRYAVTLRPLLPDERP